MSLLVHTPVIEIYVKCNWLSLKREKKNSEIKRGAEQELVNYEAFDPSSCALLSAKEK